MALDGYENAEQRNHKDDRRPRIEHIETVAAADIPRFGKLGVIASMQPLHSYPDADTLDVWARNAGPDRASKRPRSEEHTSELQSLTNLVCRLLLEKKKENTNTNKTEV